MLHVMHFRKNSHLFLKSMAFPLDMTILLIVLSPPKPQRDKQQPAASYMFYLRNNNTKYLKHTIIL